MESKTVSTRLNPIYEAKLKQLASKEKRTVSNFLKIIIENYLKRKK